MTQWIRPGDCVLDVGANQGLFFARLLDLVGDAGSVHAFEPNDELVPKLRELAAGRPAVVNEVGVSDHVGTAEFFVDARAALGGVASSLEKLHGMHGTNNVKPVTIRLTSLDTYCAQQHISPQFIKIDVEGHELGVLRGAAQTINRCRPILVFEFWESWWNRGVKQIFDYLKRDYVLVRVEDGVVVNDWYESHAGDGTVNIGCIPVLREPRQTLRTELLTSDA